MAQVPIEQAYQIALQHHQAGRLQQAEVLYRQILAQEPKHAGALHLLGVIAHQAGRTDVAVELIRQSIAFNPNSPEAYCNLGVVLQAAGRPDEAVTACRQAITLNPNYAEAHSNLGNALRDKGRLDEAIAACRRAIALEPHWAEAHYNLGNSLSEKGQLDQAVAAYRQAIALKPELPEAHNNLGNVLRAKGQVDQAIVAGRQAIALKPNYPEAHNNLGVALSNNGQLDEAIAAYHRAIALKPDYPEAHSNLGVALEAKGRLDEAVAAYRQAVALKPDYPGAHSNLGMALQAKGQLDDAIAAYRRAIALKPDWPMAHSNLVYALHFHPAYDAQAILTEHREWARRHAAPFAAEAALHHDNDRSPDRRLRIGYVSGDFHNHFTARVIEPVLARHDRAAFEVFCYSNVRNEDAVTRRLRDYGHAWRNIFALDDAQAAAMIRADRIDILVDLAQHTAGNRLLAFARKPAPVQVAYLGYPATTGLGTIDYRITDSYLDPPGVSDADNSEKLVRLPHFYECFPPPGDEPVGDLPALQNGFATFGCLNKLAKVTAPAIRLWCDLLKRVPESRLLLLIHGPGQSQEFLRRHFEAQSIESTRLEFALRCPRSQFLRLYNRIDISLDPFPHNGHMSSCDSLWMGVPLVTLRGRTSVGRFGVSLLSNLGLERLIADTPERYVDIAATLAADLPQLGQLRRTLRQRMEHSPIMDAAACVGDLETAYRWMWRQWCAAAGRGDG